MADNQDNHMLRYNQPKNNSNSLFSCLNCYADEGELREKSLSNRFSPGKTNIIKMETVPSSSRRQYYQPNLYTQQIGDSKKSVGSQDPKKVSISQIKNRKSVTGSLRTSLFLENNGTQNLICDNPDPSNVMVPQKNQTVNAAPRISITESTNRTSTPGNINNHCQGMRQSKPTVAFTYQKQLQQASQTTRTHTRGSQVIRETFKHQETPLQPLKQSQMIVVTGPKEYPNQINLQFNERKLSELYHSKESYESLELNLLKKGSSSVNSQDSKKKKLQRSKDNFGHGGARLKVRQTISIRQPQDDDDAVHESIVLSRANNSLFLQGLLNPINENQQLQSCINPNGIFRRMDSN